MTTVTLDTCANEPIHIPGAIQPHGVLLACRGGELLVVHVSANVAAHLGAEPAAVLGRSLLELFDDDSQRALADAAASTARMREANPLSVTAVAGARFDAILHVQRDLVIVELEPPLGVPDDLKRLDQRLRGSVRTLQSARDVASLCTIAAQQVRAITGFDRVMVYRFDRDWNGEVVAEDRRADLPPLLGQHYPASDIPAQARRLYTANWLRFIPDVDYQPSPIVPAAGPDAGEPLDLSHAVLRSVSPIHIEYMHNMGVTASMSVSLVIDGVLSGLIACHHYAGPRFVPYRNRDTAEYLGQALSWHLGVLEGADLAERLRQTRDHEAAIVRSMVTSGVLLDGLAVPDLLALTSADGVVVHVQEGARQLGECPSPALVERLVGWLRGGGHDVYATEQLSAVLPGADAESTVAGVLAVAISRDLGEYILWFRRPTDQTIDWAGDPHKVEVVLDGQAPRLSPRGSFALWRELVKGRSLPWLPYQVEAASTLRRVLLAGVRFGAAELRKLNESLLEADRAKDSFIALVGHELRTPLNAIVGWAQLLQAGSVPEDRWAHALDVIARNALSQAQIIEDLLDVSRIVSDKLTIDVATVDLAAVVDGALESLALAMQAKGLRLKRTLDSNATVLGDVTRLRQVVSNLIANAIKFTPKGGSVTVSLRRDGSDLELVVADSGQGIAPAFLPHVFEAFRQADMHSTRRTQGLGLGLAIVRKLVELHGGRVWAASPGEGQGATFSVRIPVASVRSETPERGVPRLPRPRGLLNGLRCLVVEDEQDARELVSFVLAGEGAEVTDAPDALTALQLLAVERYDVLVSDVGMPDLDGLQMIRRLRAMTASPNRAIPAAALTAFTRAVDRTSALEAGFDAHIPKPVDPGELVAVVSSVSRRHAR